MAYIEFSIPIENILTHLYLDEQEEVWFKAIYILTAGIREKGVRISDVKSFLHTHSAQQIRKMCEDIYNQHQLEHVENLQ